MSPNRTQAYRRVIHTLRELGPSKLLNGEQDRIRTAADNLIFSSDLSEDVAAQEALEDAGRLRRETRQPVRGRHAEVWIPVTAHAV